MTGDTTKDLVVTIEKVTKELVQNSDKKEDAMVAYLKGQKPMIVNSTNAKAIASALGSPYVEDWMGKRITLFVAKIKAFGENVDALRVRREPAKLPELNPNNPKWKGAVKFLTDGGSIDKIEEAYSLTTANREKLLSESI